MNESEIAERIKSENSSDADTQLGSVTRRAALAAGVVGAAGVTLAACAGGAGSQSNGGQANQSGAAPTGAATGGTVIAQVSEVPKGGATIAGTDGGAFVVSQTQAGAIACFSAVCTHQGCLCSRVVDNKAVCPCHGSSFDVFTGAVVRGPAQQPLAKIETKVTNGQIVAK